MILLALIEALVHHRKSLVLILVKQRQNFGCVCITTVSGNSYLNGKKIHKYKAKNKNVKFPNLYLISISRKKYFVDDLSTKVCVPSKIKDVNVKAFNMTKNSVIVCDKISNATDQCYQQMWQILYMESYPPPLPLHSPTPRKMGGRFHWALGDLKVLPAPGGA